MLSGVSCWASLMPHRDGTPVVQPNRPHRSGPEEMVTSRFLEEVWSLVHHVLAWCVVVVGGGRLPGVRHNLFSRIALERCFSETSESFYSSWYNGVKNKKRGGCQMERGVSVFGRWWVNGSQASPASFNQSSDLLLGSTNWPQNMFWLGVCCQVSYTF